MKLTKLFIDNKWVDPVDGGEFETYNPATGEVIAKVAAAGAADVDKAVKAARRALETGPWSTMDAADRGRLLFKLADLVEKNADELAALESLNCGKTITDSKGDMDGVVNTLRYYAGWADKIEGRTVPVRGNFLSYTLRQPVGVVGQIIPWNFPLLMLAWKWGPALACGNTIVLKPAEQTPLTALRIAELAQRGRLPGRRDQHRQRHGRDDRRGPGRSSRTSTRSPSPATSIRPRSSRRPPPTRSSGRPSSWAARAPTSSSPTPTSTRPSPARSTPSTSTAASAARPAAGCSSNRRSTTSSSSAWPRRPRAAIVGDPLDPKTEQGPQVSQEQLDKILHYVKLGEKQGATLLTGGERVGDKGFFVEPTIFDNVKDDMAIAKDEIFGPVVSVLPFKGVDEVIDRANNTYYGLAAAIWTKDIDKAHLYAKKVKAGTVWVNCYHVVDTTTPFGGFKMSGQGRENGEAALEHYTELKTVTVKLG